MCADLFQICGREIKSFLAEPSLYLAFKYLMETLSSKLLFENQKSYESSFNTNAKTAHFLEFFLLLLL